MLNSPKNVHDIVPCPEEKRALQEEDSPLVTIAHEIRNTLNSLSGFVDLLADDFIDFKKHEFTIKTLTNRVQRTLDALKEDQDIFDEDNPRQSGEQFLGEIVDTYTHLRRSLDQDTNAMPRLLKDKDYQKIQYCLILFRAILKNMAEKFGISLEIATEPVALRVFQIPEAVKTLEQAKIKEKDITFEIQIADTTIADMILTPDGTAKILEVAMNLLHNALKFTPKGGKTTFEISRYPQNTSVLQFSIIDNGPGIPEDKLQDIFSFRQTAKSEATTSAEGTGIGLAICQELVQKLGGEIIAKNNDTQGANFCFTVPIPTPKFTKPAPTRNGAKRSPGFKRSA